MGLLLAIAGNGFYVLFGPNFHAVLPGEFYRSAQPSGARLERDIGRYQIRTVLNLRGCCENVAWYLEEARVTHRRGVAQEDVTLSAGRLPSVHELRRLIEVIDHSERPVLIHCRRGSDRTGLAAVIVLLLHTDAPLAECLKQLGPFYGHVALGRTEQIARFFDLYEAWLAAQGVGHTPAVFRRWAREGYSGGPCRCEITLIEPLETAPAERSFAVRVRIRNTSPELWRLRPGNNAGIHAAFGVYDADRRRVATGRAGLFDAEVPPGESLDLTLVVPGQPRGRYRLLVDMTEEQHCWFLQTGSTPFEKEFEVRE